MLTWKCGLLEIYIFKVVATFLHAASYSMSYSYSGNTQVRSQRSVGTNSSDTCCLSYLYCTQKRISEVQFGLLILLVLCNFPGKLKYSGLEVVLSILHGDELVGTWKDELGLCLIYGGSCHIMVVSCSHFLNGSRETFPIKSCD